MQSLLVNLNRQSLKKAKKKVGKLEQTLADSEEQFEASMKDMRQEEAELGSTVAALDNALQILGMALGFDIRHICLNGLFLIFC